MLVVLNSTGVIMPQGTVDNAWRRVSLSQFRGAVDLYWIEVRDLLNMVQCQGQVPITYFYRAQNVTSVRLVNPGLCYHQSLEAPSSFHQIGSLS